MIIKAVSPCLVYSCLWYFQTFSELIEAASKGDQHGVDQFNDDLLTVTDSAEGDESMYSQVAKQDVQQAPELAYCFGKAVGSEIGINVVSCY